MFARYAYIKGATPANILADVCAILCGTTDKTTLSAACDQASTEIHFSLNPATFTLHDNAASASPVGKVLKQRAADNSCDKFLHLSASTTTFNWGASETWNAATHVGTNNTNNGTTSFDSSNQSSASCFDPVNNTGFIYLYSDTYLTLFSFRSTAISYSYVPLIETTREGPLMLLGYGYPNWGVGYLNLNSFKRPRAKNIAGSGAVTCNAANSGVLAGFLTKSPYSTSAINFATARTTTEAAITSLFRIKDFPAFTLTNNSVQEYIGKCLSEVKFGTINIAGVIEDEFIYNNITHVFLNQNTDIFSAFTTFIPKG